MMEALGEAFALTRKSGVEPQMFLEVFQSVFASSPIFGRYATLIAQEKYEPAGLRAAAGAQGRGAGRWRRRERRRCPMPLASLLRDHFLEGIARGMGDKDWSSLGALAAQRAGLDTK